MNAIIDAGAAHTAMSKQASDLIRVREGLKDVLRGPAEPYEALRAKAAEGQPRAWTDFAKDDRACATMFMA